VDMKKNNVEFNSSLETFEDSCRNSFGSESFDNQVSNKELLEDPKKKRREIIPFLKNAWEDLQGDKINILLLFFLYTLQGLPIGLSEAIPIELQNRNVDYKEQAKFNFVFYPFSMKLIWAPIVDSCFLARFGRRKSWLVPAQCGIGITMLVTSQFVEQILGKEATDTEPGVAPDVTTLTAIFFILNLLAATQDVAVDGWALTMLKPGNVGYVSSCNILGQALGWVLGYICYTNLETAGVLTLREFLLICGGLFLVTTTLLAIFKHDRQGEEEEPVLGLVDTYKVLWRIIRHPLIPVVILFLMTYKFGVAAAESLINLKLVEKGVPSNKVTWLSIPIIPVKFILIIMLSVFTSGPRPMTPWLVAYPLRLFFCLLLPLMVFLATILVTESGEFPTYFFVILLTIFALRLSTDFTMQLSIMAFFARISDPAVGGTYMTLLNTFNNLGTMWPRSFSLWFVSIITQKECHPATHLHTSLAPNQTIPYSSEDTCHTVTEGYYILSTACCCLGYLWLIWGWRAIRQLQRVDPGVWRVVGRTRDNTSQDKEERFKYFYCA